MRNVLDDLAVARGRLRVVRTRRQRRRGRVAQPLLAHALHFALLRLGELRRNDDQTQIDHEERADLFETTNDTIKLVHNFRHAQATDYVPQ